MSFAASADIIVTPGPGNFAGDENVLFSGAGTDATGNPVTGLTNQTGTLVDFNSTTSTLNAPANGQARVTGDDLTDLSFSLQNPTLGFATAIFNINASATSTVDLAVEWACVTGQTCTGGAGGTVVGNYALSNGGQNFFRVQAINNQLITNISLGTSADITDLRQIRLGGVSSLTGPGGDPGDIPEPMSMSLMGLGLSGLFLYRKFRK
jgi:hypothetical protein